MSLLPSFSDYEKIIKKTKKDAEDRGRYNTTVEAVRDTFLAASVELRNRMFKEQAAFWLSPALLSSALCTRRAGKTEGAKLEILATALSVREANILYGTLTKDKARSLCWNPILKELSQLGFKRCTRGILLEEPEADFKTDDVRLEITFKNGSRIKLTGFDASEKEQEKVLGEPYDLVILDEVQSFRGNVEDLVYAKLLITVAERRGRIKMIGTPGDVRLGFFYEVNCTDKPQKLKWEIHKWSWRDNVGISNQDGTRGMKMCQIFQEMLDLIIKTNPNFVKSPEYFTEWCGEYYVDSDNLVYKFDPILNVGHPSTPIEFAILGVDLGYADESAFVVFGWGTGSPDLYELYSYKEEKMDLDQVASTIISIREQFPELMQIVIDSANTQGIQTIENRYALGMTPANKMGKFEHIRLMNTDLRRGRIKFAEGSPWIAEVVKLKKKITQGNGGQGKIIEDQKAPNHCADAALYAYLQCRQYWYTEQEVTQKKSVLEITEEEEFKKRFEKPRFSDIDREEGFANLFLPSSYYE